MNWNFNSNLAWCRAYIRMCLKSAITFMSPQVKATLWNAKLFLGRTTKKKKRLFTGLVTLDLLTWTSARARKDKRNAWIIVCIIYIYIICYNIKTERVCFINDNHFAFACLFFQCERGWPEVLAVCFITSQKSQKNIYTLISPVWFKIQQVQIWEKSFLFQVGSSSSFTLVYD